jgi:hypothetical protein
VLVKSSARFSRGIVALLALAALTIATLSVPLMPALASPAAGPASVTGMIVPLYTSPTDGSWAALILAKDTYPGVPIVAIVNPQSGPGPSASAAYASGIQALQAAGITVLGYVATDYGTTPITFAEQQIVDYWTWYHVNGTMFDMMPATSGYEGYYSSLNAYAKSLGMTYTVGNPGGSIATSYIGTLDTLIIYENSGLPTAPSISSLYAGYGRGNFSVISYGVASPTQSPVVNEISSSVGYIYFTGATLPNPYHSLPAYLMSEVAALNVRRR